MHRAHSGHSVDLGGTGRQRTWWFCGWTSPKPAGATSGNHTGPTSCSRQDQGSHSGLLQLLQPESHLWNINVGWHWLEKSIITGCTISMILFLLAMNMLVKSAEVEYRGPLTKSGVQQPRSDHSRMTRRAWMDFKLAKSRGGESYASP